MVELRTTEPEVELPKFAAESRLILITQGRESGRSEAALLQYRRVNNDFLIIASNGDSQVKPDWYLNLREQPCVRVEILDASFHARAYTPTGLGRVRLLPFVNDLLARRDSSIPRETTAVLLSPLY